MNLYRLLLRLAAVSALALNTLPAIAAAKTACDTLTTAEIGKVLGGSVVIDRDQSGPDDRGGDNCVWAGANKSNILIRIQRVADKSQVERKYKDDLVEAYANGKAPEALTGVGDEAKYRNYVGTLKGGVIVGRKGPIIFVVEGSVTREALAALANTMLSRL